MTERCKITILQLVDNLFTSEIVTNTDDDRRFAVPVMLDWYRQQLVDGVIVIKQCIHLDIQRFKNINNYLCVSACSV